MLLEKENLSGDEIDDILGIKNSKRRTRKDRKPKTIGRTQPPGTA
jgi:hypothetical protein